MQDEPIQSHAPPAAPAPVAVPKPTPLTNEEFRIYLDWVRSGTPEHEVMAMGGITRKTYWMIQCASNRRENRGLLAEAKRQGEFYRRHEKWEKLFERAMNDRVNDFTARNGNRGRIRKRFGSLRAIRRWSAYNQYQDRRATESPPA